MFRPRQNWRTPASVLLPVGQRHHDGRNIGETDILELFGRERRATAGLALHVYLAVHLDFVGIA